MQQSELPVLKRILIFKHKSNQNLTLDLMMLPGK